MSMSVVEAGRRGGLTVLKQKGRGFYAEIGRKGQVPRIGERIGYRGKAVADPENLA